MFVRPEDGSQGYTLGELSVDLDVRPAAAEVLDRYDALMIRTAFLCALILPATAARAADFNVVDYGATPDGRTPCTAAIQKAIVAAGYAEAPLEHFTLENVAIEAKEAGKIEHAAGWVFKDVHVVAQDGKRVVMKDCKEMTGEVR